MNQDVCIDLNNGTQLCVVLNHVQKAVVACYIDESHPPKRSQLSIKDLYSALNESPLVNRPGHEHVFETVGFYMPLLYQQCSCGCTRDWHADDRPWTDADEQRFVTDTEADCRQYQEDCEAREVASKMESIWTTF